MSAPVDVPLPKIQVPLVKPGSWLADTSWYQFFESLKFRSGGDNDFIFEALETLETKADKDTTITANSPLSSSGTLGSGVVITFVADGGWTVSTGTPNKGAYTVYTAGTASVTYDQTELQSVMNAMESASQRIKALEDALFDRGVISA